MAKFNINDYPGKYVMHVTTEEQDTIFRNYLHSVGKHWRNGDSYDTITHFDKYREYTVYHFNENTFGNLINAKLLYSPAPTILKFEDFDWSDFTMKKEFTKADLKNGDVVKDRKGNIHIVCIETGTLICKNGWDDLSQVCDDLTHKLWSSADIVAVRRPLRACDCQFSAFTECRGKLVYERKEVEEMTLEEVCKALGKEIKIVKN